MHKVGGEIRINVTRLFVACTLVLERNTQRKTPGSFRTMKAKSG